MAEVAAATSSNGTNDDADSSRHASDVLKINGKKVTLSAQGGM